MPRLLDSPTNANLPLMPPDAIARAMQIDPIVAAMLGAMAGPLVCQAEKSD